MWVGKYLNQLLPSPLSSISDLYAFFLLELYYYMLTHHKSFLCFVLGIDFKNRMLVCAAKISTYKEVQ